MMCLHEIIRDTKITKEVVCNGTLSVKMNSQVGANFQSKKGSDAGDLLPPFLCNIRC
jgi:hypothetical protein